MHFIYFRYRLTFVDIGEYGHRGDANVFDTSSLKTKLDGNELALPDPAVLPGIDDTSLKIHPFIVADTAFPLSVNIMKPFSGAQLSHDQRVYNYRYSNFLDSIYKKFTSRSRARRIIENVFCIFCAKWRLLLKPIETSIENANWIVRAIGVLHNFLIDESKGQYRPDKLADWETADIRDAENGEWRRLLAGTAQLQQIPGIPAHAVHWPSNAKAIREYLMNYFNNDAGSVPWQEKMI